VLDTEVELVRLRLTQPAANADAVAEVVRLGEHARVVAVFRRDPVRADTRFDKPPGTDAVQVQAQDRRNAELRKALVVDSAAPAPVPRQADLGRIDVRP
jgi:hypothetical protein